MIRSSMLACVRGSDQWPYSRSAFGSLLLRCKPTKDSRSSKARAMRTTLRVPQIGSAPKRPDAPLSLPERNGGRLPHGRRSTRSASRAHQRVVSVALMAKITARARWFAESVKKKMSMFRQAFDR